MVFWLNLLISVDSLDFTRYGLLPPLHSFLGNIPGKWFYVNRNTIIEKQRIHTVFEFELEVSLIQKCIVFSYLHELFATSLSTAPKYSNF